jgi:hypothetical protein
LYNDPNSSGPGFIPSDRNLDKPIPDSIGKSYTLEPVAFTLTRGIFEPFFFSAAIYDGVLKKKISENMYFDLNSSDMIGLIRDNPIDIESVIKKFIFHISLPNPDMYLVIQIDKVLEGDISDVSEKYTNLKAKANTDFAESLCLRLGKQRQPFAFAAVPLFNELLEIETDVEEHPEISIKTIFRIEADKMAEEDLYEFLNGFKKGASLKRFKIVPGELNIKLSEVADDAQIPNKLSSSLVPALPTNDTIEKCKIVQEFSPLPILMPHFELNNLIYVYPIAVNLSKASGKARNVACKIQYISQIEQQNFGSTALKVKK